MAMHGNLESSAILVQIRNLYLNKNFSDVTFMIGNEKLYAHQNILGQRCPVFKRQFINDDEEHKNHTIVAPEPLEAFKLLLKYIYTGFIELDDLYFDELVEVLLLAKKYEMPQLENLCVDQIKPACVVDNIAEIVNEAVDKSLEILVAHCLDYIKVTAAKFVPHKSFKELTVKTLQCILETTKLNLPSKEVFRSLVDWMKANPEQKEHFPTLLKNVDLCSVDLNELVTAILPLNLIDGNALMQIVYEQAKKPTYPDGNVMMTYGARVITGGISTFFTIPAFDNTLKHAVGSNDECITIDLMRLCMLNFLVMDLADGNKSYWIDVSEDNTNWTRIIDHTAYPCRHRQRLLFKECPVRYIRICGTASSDGIFEIMRLEAYHSKESFEVDPETNFAIPPNNGSILDIRISHAYQNHVFIQLPQPYLIDNMNISLQGGSVDFGAPYSYSIDVSTDNMNWTRVFSKENVRYWSRVEFNRTLVVFIKVTAYDYEGEITCAHLECPANGDFMFVN